MDHKLIIIMVLSTFIVGAFCHQAPLNQHHQQYLEQHQQQEHKHIHIPIVKQSFEQSHGAFRHSYETGNGIHVQEQGYFKESGDKKHPTLVQEGVIVYSDEHGNPIQLHYIADENGFQPQGAHLPTPPPIPEEIAKALATLPQHVETDEGHGLDYHQPQQPQYAHQKPQQQQYPQHQYEQTENYY